MKKIIAISVMFVLLTGAAFAVDVGGTVIGSATVLQGDNTKDSKVTSGGGLNRLRFEGSGQDESGTYGGFIRLGDGNSPGFNGMVWWKPLDWLKFALGGNPDGLYGKEGVTGWMFYQTAYDTDVVIGGNVWGWGPADKKLIAKWTGQDEDDVNGGNYNMYGHDVKFRDAFFGGFGGRAALLEITPADMLGINIVLPFYDGGETADVFKKVIAQLDVKLDFGNIALTYVGGRGYKKGTIPAAPAAPDEPTYGWQDHDDDPATPPIWGPDAAPEAPTKPEGGYDEPASIFAYFGGSFGPLAVDFGLGYKFASADGNYANPIAVGLGLKYSADAFGVKVRAMGKLAGDDKLTRILADVLPYFVLSDTLRAFVSVGLGMIMPDQGDSWMDWHFNPYLEVGQEWGAKFLAGIKVWQDFNGDEKFGGAMHWAVPVAIIINF